jgi:hypothetical protein
LGRNKKEERKVARRRDDENIGCKRSFLPLVRPMHVRFLDLNRGPRVTQKELERVMRYTQKHLRSNGKGGRKNGV